MRKLWFGWDLDKWNKGIRLYVGPRDAYELYFYIHMRLSMQKLEPHNEKGYRRVSFSLGPLHVISFTKRKEVESYA